jgi:AAA domain
MQDKSTALKITNNSKGPEVSSDLRMPTLGELLKLTIPERRCLLHPWLREHESCLLYAATGVGKSLFALTAALAVAGNGSFLGWKPDTKADGTDWRVLYVDGEMHIGDIQHRARTLMDAVPDISRTKAQSNLQFLARQHQDPAVNFPEITDAEQGGGQQLILDKVLDGKFDLVILDNFSTLGRVADENEASSFDDILSLLLKLKKNVATILVHHTNKSDETYRGSTKLAATFEIMLHLKRYAGDVGKSGDAYRDREAVRYGEAQFEIEWHKLRSQRAVGRVLAKLTTTDRQGEQVACWDYSTSLDLLNALKVYLEAGLFATKAEIAKAARRQGRDASDIIDKGVRLHVWTHANVREWLTNGKKKRKAGETTALTAALSGPRTYAGEVDVFNDEAL